MLCYGAVALQCFDAGFGDTKDIQSKTWCYSAPKITFWSMEVETGGELTIFGLMLTALVRSRSNVGYHQQACCGLPKPHRGYSNLGYIGDAHWANIKMDSALSSLSFRLFTPTVR